MNHEVTILIPTYNRIKYISESIESCLAQTISNKIKILVYDDGSTDNTHTRIRNNFKSVNVIRSEKNEGIGNARNQLLKALNTPYGAWLDSDDTMPNDRIEKCLTYLQNNLDKDIVYTFIKTFPTNKHIEIDTDLYTKNDINSLKHNTTCATGFFRKCLKKYQMPNVRYGGEDVLWVWNLINNSIGIGHIPEYLYFYRRHDQSISRIKEKHQRERLLEQTLLKNKIIEYKNNV